MNCERVLRALSQPILHTHRCPFQSEKVLVLTQVRRKLSGDMQKCLVHVAETLRDKHGLEAGRALERITDEVIVSLNWTTKRCIDDLLMQVFASSSSLRFIENIAILPVAQELSGQITLGDVGPGLTKMTEYFGCAAWTDWHVILQSATPACKCGFGGNRTYAVLHAFTGGDGASCTGSWTTLCVTIYYCRRRG